jgi:predicted dehydrogenase
MTKTGKPTPPLNIALYGANGHQIHQELTNHPSARLTAIAKFPREKLPPALQKDPAIRTCANLEELLDDPAIDLISLCSPRRSDQANDAIKSLQAGKHVYAEKPCALNETQLDTILRTAKHHKRQFHEMAGTAFFQPYHAMRQIIRDHRLGPIIQITAEKSYPYQNWRPQDETLDGGLITQCAIHALRLVEHVAGLQIQSLQATETTTGNPVPGGHLRMAAALLLKLQNGAIATINANYLNPPGTRTWGYETLRIIGARGFVESTQGGAHTRLVIKNRDHGPLDTRQPGPDYLNALIQTLLGRGKMPLTLQQELNPTRWALRAKHQADPHWQQTAQQHPPTRKKKKKKTIIL